ncbi:MAG: phenylalanine--tRNA ligase subunit beta [Spirochaetes bacterium]|jgi:phenylalanyl-tRNA synthetase beta chain|nr:phenylalanine--tRNA ligase subunit beta [Spirochaetota bacterium]
MWISLNIISKMVSLDGISPEDIAQRLTMSSAEIECLEYANRHFTTIITAKILDVKPHPNADKLTLVDLSTGSENHRVVCGAPNHKKGDIVPLAMPGTEFSKDFIIKKSKIRGEESSGMLCSEKELGLSDDHSGILIFPEGTPAGKSLAEIFPDSVDVRLEIDNKSITHRPDLWSHMGFAREIAALYGRPFTDVIDRSLESGFKNAESLKVEIMNPEAAPRYSGLVVKNIKIGDSPDWLKAAVTSIGMRPINNIVDITNYVMAEVGEPMHAFDRKKLTGDRIIVRLARQGEPIMTLDGQTFTLTSEDIVIADNDKPIALAGVMGGGNSEIDDSTTEIVLEAATFNPVNIRKTAQRFNQRTEAAMRFEKSLSPELTAAALIRCYDLIKKCIPGAVAVSKILDAYPVKQKTVKIKTDTEFIKKRIGQKISDERITGILKALDFRIEIKGTDLELEVPHYRATKDISIPEDIVEEVGRIYGFDNIAESAPMVPCTPPRRNEFRLFERKVKGILSMHFNMIETSGYSFVGEDFLNRLGINEDRELRLANPLSMEQDRLRRSLVPNAVKSIMVNMRNSDYFKTYEMGRIYIKDDRKSKELTGENTRVCGLVYSRQPDAPLFYEAKEIVCGLIEMISMDDIVMVPESKELPPYAHPGRSMLIKTGGKDAGIISEFHPKTLKSFDIQGRSAFFDIDLNMLFDAEKTDKKFCELQKYPDVPFELSILADRYVHTADIISHVIKTSPEYIKSAEVISIYEGAQIPEGKKSVSIKTVYRASDRTLSPEEIAGLQKKLIESMNRKGFTLR